jgi:hypothetical protein
MNIIQSELSLQERYVLQRQPALYQWYLELKSILNSNDNTENSISRWSLLGQGFIIEGEDKDAYLHFLNWVSEALPIELLKISLSEIDEINDRILKVTGPAIFYIEPSNWLDGENIPDEAITAKNLVIDALNLAKGKSMLLTSICDSYGAIHEEFRYSGRFDRHITWTAPRPETYAEDFINKVGSECLEDSLVLSRKRLGSLLCIEFPTMRRLGMLSIALQRKYQRNACKVGWKDVLEIAIHGTGDGDHGHPSIDLSRVAAHESGHAVVAIVESKGSSVPDWVSVLPGKDMIGIMVASYTDTYGSSGFKTFVEARAAIRVGLGGRVAEELMLGELNVGATCASEDLKDVTWQVMRLVLENGFTATYGAKPYEGYNLLVQQRSNNSRDCIYAKNQARLFIQAQYQEVKRIILNNIDLLKIVQERLMTQQLLLRDDLLEIVRRLNQEKKLIV